MKPTELRIRNWYMSVKFKTPVQCDLSDLYNLCANSDGAYNDPPIDDMFTPIPLTEDWLKKFGFKMEVHPNPFMYLEEWFTEIPDDESYTGKWCNFSFTKAKDSYYLDYSKNRTEDSRIKYVHQLQNLYFALTGKELNYGKIS